MANKRPKSGLPSNSDQNKGKQFTSYIQPSEFLKAITAPFLQTPYIDVTLQNGVFSIKEDLVLSGGGAFDNVISNIAQSMFSVAESNTPIISYLFKVLNSIAIKSGSVIAFAVNTLTNVINGLLDNLKDAKFLGIDVTPAKLDRGITYIEQLLNIDFEGAYGIGIVLSMVLLIAIAVVVFKFSPTAVPLLGGLLGDLIKLVVRIIRSILGILNRRSS